GAEREAGCRGQRWEKTEAGGRSPRHRRAIKRVADALAQENAQQTVVAAAGVADVGVAKIDINAAVSADVDIGIDTIVVARVYAGIDVDTVIARSGVDIGIHAGIVACIHIRINAYGDAVVAACDGVDIAIDTGVAT